MKTTSSAGRKLRYGSLSVILTALIIAAVILVNVIFSALAQRFMWYVDLTPPLEFTLSEEAKSIVEKGDAKFESDSPIEMVQKFREETGNDDLKINIIFCTDPDTLEGNETQKHVYWTAKQLQAAFSDYIDVQTYNIIKEPSSVSRFKTNSLSKIYTTSVIIECGTEFRIRELRSFYTFDTEDSDTPWAYNGEKAFVSSILAVTRAESPIACITTNHGEAFDTETAEFVTTLYDAGYVIQELDLKTQEIPEKCRLIVVFDPKSDFSVIDGVSEIDEIAKLDAYLDNSNSLMVFMNPDTQKLPNFEEYLEEWGIAFNRTVDAGGIESSHLVKDSSQALTTDGYTFIAEYAIGGAGSKLTEDMRSRPVPQKMIFKHAMSLSYTYNPATYVPDDTASSDAVRYNYGSYSENGTYRNIYDVFVTSENAVAYAGSTTTPIQKATANEPIKLMTVTVEDDVTQEDNYSTINEATYVLACGSTEIASSTLLQSNSYGNTDFFLTALRAIGREPVPVGLTFKPFADSTIDTITTADSTWYTVTFASVPALAALITGIVIIVRRKNR